MKKQLILNNLNFCIGHLDNYGIYIQYSDYVTLVEKSFTTSDMLNLYERQIESFKNMFLFCNYDNRFCSYFFSYLTSRGVLISGLLYQQRHFDFYNQLDLKDDMQNGTQ